MISNRSGAGGEPFGHHTPDEGCTTSSNVICSPELDHGDEYTPLLIPRENVKGAAPEMTDSTTETDDTMQSTKSAWYMFLLTIGLGGLQVAWSVELSNGTPYLLSLGISKSVMALVWIAGPLSGTLVQPYIGLLSDNCRCSIGKRKPFMIGGAAATVISLMFLAWVKEVVGAFVSMFGVASDSKDVWLATIILAVIGVYALDVAINTVQAAIRAFILDCAPAHQQEAANAMASRVLGTGNILGYIAGYVDLTRRFWFLGHNQFQILCAFASLGLAISVGVSVLMIPERDPRQAGPPKNKPSFAVFFLTLFTSIKRLPVQVKRVCQVQFFAWIGFFPFLFYTSSYVGGLYAESILREHPDLSKEQLDRLHEEATRIGTFALLIYSIVSLGVNVLAPFIVPPTYDTGPLKLNSAGRRAPHQSTDENKLSAALIYLRIPGLTLKRAWFGSLLIFSAVSLSTVVIRSVSAATTLIGMAGITWAMTLWAPWAIISAEVSRRDAAIRARKARADVAHRVLPATLSGPVEAVVRDGEALIRDTGDEVQNIEEEIDDAGVVLGIHNMAIAAPQMIATFASSIIFKVWQKPRDTPGDKSMTIVFALGGICVLIASTFVTRIEDNVSAPSDVRDDERSNCWSAEESLETPFLQSRRSMSSR